MKYAEQNGHPTLEELLPVLQSELESYSRCFIVIDALDECPYETRFRLLDILRHLPVPAKSMITSRDLPELKERFSEDERETITSIRLDMEIYINNRISTNPRLTRLIDASSCDSPREAIAKRVIQNSEDM
jgi:hypothetical protein